MNFQNLNFDYVEPPRTIFQSHNLPRTPSDQSQVTAVPICPQTGDHKGGQADHASSQAASLSPRPTVVPYAPTPPSPSTSQTETYGPDRIFGPPLVPQQSYAPRTARMAESPEPQPLLHLSTLNTVTNIGGDGMQMDFKDDLARAAGAVTPGQDDGQYIQYALDALSRPDPRYSLFPRGSGDGLDDVDRGIPDEGLGYYQPPARRQRINLTQPNVVHVSEPDDDELGPPQPVAVRPGMRMPGPPTPYLPFAQEPQTPEQSRLAHVRSGVPVVSSGEYQTPMSSAASLVFTTPRIPVLKSRVMSDEWEAFDVSPDIKYQTSRDMLDGFGPLNFKPRLLQPASLGALMVLCLLMLVALIFCAAFSQVRQGLVPFEGLYGGLYFVFRILPAILAAVILIYAQCTVTVIYRFLPFVNLHSEDREERHGTIFEDLYPRSFLWPRLVGPWQLRLAIIATWLANMTLPLQSAAFTVILVDGTWKWAATQGVVWTLVALYLLLLISMGIMMAYWMGVTDTGLLWDARSLADMIAIISSTNVASDYRGTDKLGTRSRLQWSLRRRVSDRLGYWGWRNRRQGFWYTVGNSLTDKNYLPRETLHDAEKTTMSRDDEHDLEASVHAPAIRYRYLPWCLRISPLIYFNVTALVVFVALLVVSFLPSTRIVAGFLPLVPAAPNREAFSSANFLYSFVPSLLGLGLFQLFRALDQNVRILQPWAALATRSSRGASTQASLLADYAACLPGEAVLHAARNGHWRAALVSMLALLFAFLPPFAGGMFMALTTTVGEVRMFPHVPLFGLVLALLFLYAVGLAVLLPARRAFRLPHAVTCLAEMFSFLANDALLADPVFKHVRSRAEMLAKLGVGRDPRDQPRWVFGPAAAGEPGDDSLGVRRVRRFTEKRMAQRMARRLGGSQRVGRRASDLVLRQQ